MTATQIARLVDDEVGSRPESYGAFLRALVEAASATADHLRADWQDNASAKAWERIAAATEAASSKYDQQRPF